MTLTWSRQAAHSRNAREHKKTVSGPPKLPSTKIVPFPLLAEHQKQGPQGAASRRGSARADANREIGRQQLKLEQWRRSERRRRRLQQRLVKVESRADFKWGPKAENNIAERLLTREGIRGASDVESESIGCYMFALECKQEDTIEASEGFRGPDMSTEQEDLKPRHSTIKASKGYRGPNMNTLQEDLELRPSTRQPMNVTHWSSTPQKMRDTERIGRLQAIASGNPQRGANAM